MYRYLLFVLYYDVSKELSIPNANATTPLNEVLQKRFEE